MREGHPHRTFLSCSYGSQGESVTAPIWSRGWDQLLHLLFPAPCLGCGRPLPARRQRLSLCLPCRGRLVACRQPVCAGCGRYLGEPRPLSQRAELCTACTIAPPPCRHIWCPWVYRSPLAEVLQAFKFARLEYLGRDLAASARAEIGCALEEMDLVVPVPLHWRRRLQRRFDQAEAIARPLARALGKPLIHALRRPRATRPQTSLPRRERLRNPRRAFALRPPSKAAIHRRRVLLVDDVLTTGATLQAAARCLLGAGAQEVRGLVIARSLPRSPGNPSNDSPTK